jgi:hypothetical protein
MYDRLACRINQIMEAMSRIERWIDLRRPLLPLLASARTTAVAAADAASVGFAFVIVPEFLVVGAAAGNFPPKGLVMAGKG